MKLIEAVCSGNNGRSPIVEALIRKSLCEYGALGDYDAISSGTEVNRLIGGDYSLVEMKAGIEFVKRIGISNPSYDHFLNIIKSEQDLGYKEEVKSVMGVMLQGEVEARTKLLNELGLDLELKKSRDVTLPRDDVLIILPVDRKNYRDVLNVYKGSKFSPIISPLGVVAHGDQRAQDYALSSDCTDFISGYREIIQRLAEDTPKAVKRIIGA